MMSDTQSIGGDLVPMPATGESASKGAHAPSTRTKGGIGRVRLLVSALILVVAIAFFAYAMMFMGGADLLAQTFAGLFGGGASTSAVNQTAQRPLASGAGAQGSAGITTSSASATKTTSAGSFSIPPVAMRQLFYEQVASRETIGQLVTNKFSRFDIGSVTKSGITARLGVTARYRSGGSFSGTMVLKRFGGKWLFFSITRAGNAQVLPTSPPVNPAVVRTIVAQQVEYQSTIAGLLNGGYKKMTITGVSTGSGTKTVKYTLSGGTKPSRSSSAVAIAKTIDGTQYWFITSIR